jgi:hypothetical protein
MLIGEENTNNFPGMYLGKIVNNEDQEKRLRCQVRVVGIHSDKNKDDLFDGIPDETLPWAEQAAPVMWGFGSSKGGVHSVPEIGSFVYLFFLNNNYMKPVYFASVLGSNDADDEDFTSEKTVFKSKRGSKVVFDDTEDGESIDIKMASGSMISIMDIKGTQMSNALPPLPIPKNEIFIHVEGGTIRLSADQILLGGGAGYVVTSVTPGPVADVSVLTASSKIIG